MDKKYLVKLKSGMVKGPLLENEIDDMIYEGIVTGEEKVKEYPHGDWLDIAKIEHFYDVFMGAFELQRGVSKNKKETFVESETKVDIDKKTKSHTIADQKKTKEKTKAKKSLEETQIYTHEDIKDVSGSIIKKLLESL